ncbi:uncharacterized protein LOC134949690 [Pseudophryne corroboree]|uniref:uncharacterized protein LOC134949690 n=1 Tax=Pseudophryne corroboree TaxID=495146 RepID=UPI003081683B
MYAHLEQMFPGENLCTRCEQMVSLGAQVTDLRQTIATLREIANLEHSLQLTMEALGEQGEAEIEEDGQVGSWVTVKRRRRKRQASSGLTNPSRVTRLDKDTGDGSAEMVELDEIISPSNERNGPSGTERTVVSEIPTPRNRILHCFSSHRLPLSGYKMQKMKVNSVKKYYHVMSSPRSDSPFRALLCSPEPSAGSLVCAPPFQGIITLAEAHGDHTALNSIPDRPPLLIPQGLKQRYRPFGATAPRAVPDNVGQSQWSGSTKKKAKKRKQEGSLLMDL